MCLALVVDDDPTQQIIISKLLKKVGLDVIVANDGIEALEQVQSTSPVLVILDILMPRMNGYEVCKQLKSNEKTQDLPVLMSLQALSSSRTAQHSSSAITQKKEIFPSGLILLMKSQIRNNPTAYTGSLKFLK